MRWQHWRLGLTVAMVVGLLANRTAAEVTTEQGASILAFPKVIANGRRDTVIQITNTSNAMVHAHCFYVNGGLTFPDGPDGIPGSGDEGPSPLNPPLWTEIDFDIWLTKQQPTYWVVSQGRAVDPNDDTCVRGATACFNAGFDPGRVPPVVEDFTGELKCIEVDASGAPLSGNHLKGEATLIENGSGDAAKYNAIGIIGNDGNNGDAVLCLGGQPSPDCPNGGEYNACPQTWILSHLADGAEDPFSGEDSSVHTTITVIPCAQNFETQIPESVTIQFVLINELENIFSTSTTITCWGSFDLGDIDPIFSRDFVGTDFVQTFMRPSTGTNSGFLVVADEEHNDDGAVSTAAANLHIVGERPGPDLIVIPAEQVGP